MKEKITICKAKLDNGNIVLYTLAGPNKTDYPNIDQQYYLGEGVIYSVNGVLQNDKRKFHFWNTELSHEPKQLCRCGVNAVAEPHTCPFSEEIRNDSTSLCTCCAACEHECVMDI
jgi:hypothetical protein